MGRERQMQMVPRHSISRSTARSKAGRLRAGRYTSGGQVRGYKLKKTEQIENVYCDFCEKNPAPYSECMGCGKAICYECRKTNAQEYNHGVNVGGSGDGVYCNECDMRLRKTGDKLHAAYLAIRSLQNEQRGFYENFQMRSKTAEAVLAKLQRR